MTPAASEFLKKTFVRHVEQRAEIGSTNDLAIELAGDAALTTPALVLADRQTAGRGRGANAWWSAHGALTFSVILQPPAAWIPQERWPQISLAAALAVCGTLEGLAPSERFGVKWPNDVYCGRRKISGILAEAPALKAGVPRRLIVGIGVNVNNSWAQAPEALREVGVSLSDLSQSHHDLTGVLVTLLGELELRLDQLSRLDPRLADAWQSRNVLLHRHVTVLAGERTIAGRCQEIDANGGLVLEPTTGPQTLFGGVVQAIR